MVANVVEDERTSLEQLYAADPARYKRKVVWLMGLGYGYIVLVVALVLGWVVGGTVLFATGFWSVAFVDNFIRGSIPVLIVAGLMARAIIVRIPPPEGVYLDGALKDAVVTFFEDVRVAANGRPIDHVVIDSRFNAAVQQMPRFGLFGPARSYLILGAPLMQLLSPRELKAVIAHEFGHLSHEHGKLGAAVYRLHQTLANAAQAIERRHQGKPRPPGGALRFLRWFTQRFDRLTFAMRRGQEYEADAVAARTTGREALAAALCKLHTLEAPLGRFWNGVWKRARYNASSAIAAPIRELYLDPPVVTEEGAAEAVDLALQRETDFFDTHPALRERLRAMQTPAVRAASRDGSALDAIFAAPERDAFFDRVDAAWRKEVAGEWTRSHREYAAADEELAQLAGRVDTLDVDGLYRLARLQEDLDGLPAAFDTFRRLAATYPENAAAQFHWGRALFERDFAGAEAAFYKAAELNVELAPNVEPFLKAGYEREGRAADFARFEAFMARFEALRSQANAERENVGLDDELVPPELGQEERAALLAHASKFEELRKVYLVEKKTQAFQHLRVFLMAFEVNTWHSNVEADEQRWLGRVTDSFAGALPFLGNPFSVIVARKTRWGQRLAALRGALVYERRTSAGARVWSAIKAIYGGLGFLIFVVAVGYLIYAWLTN